MINAKEPPYALLCVQIACLHWMVVHNNSHVSKLHHVKTDTICLKVQKVDQVRISCRHMECVQP